MVLLIPAFMYAVVIPSNEERSSSVPSHMLSVVFP